MRMPARSVRWLLVCLLVGGMSSPAWALTLLPPTWQQLTPAQQEVLAPLAADWAQFPAQKKRRHVNVADHYPSMTPAEQARVRERLPNWVELAPAQREEARKNMKKLLDLPPDTRRQAEERLRAQLPPVLPPSVTSTAP